VTSRCLGFPIVVSEALGVHTVRVLTTLLTGIFTLAGVTTGVLLEPLKAVFAARARARNDRADRCARLVEAAMTSRAISLELNRLNRQGGSQADIDAAVGQYRRARGEIRQVVATLHLYGPDNLATSADRLRSADRELRARRFDGDDADSLIDVDAWPTTVVAAAEKLERAVFAFTVDARKYMR